jgi:hypothetical protein
MSIISNEHQSGSPFDSEPEPSEPGCICGRGVRCPLHGGPPQPVPEPATTEHQPGSPGAELKTPYDGWVGGEGHIRRRIWVEGFERGRATADEELRTLRARVESYAMDLAALEGTNAANEGALRIQLERLHEERSRAESAEARVKELEAAADRNANVIYADESVERYRKRIADLESQLAAAREENGLEARVATALGPRYQALQLTRLAMSGIWQA